MASPFNSNSAKTPDPFEFLKALWTPMGMPMPGLVTPTLDVGEVEKRIADLKSVESWLNLNLNVLRMTIQGLEMQKATFAAMQGMQGGVAGAVTAALDVASASAQSPAANPAADAWWTVLQQAQKATEQAVNQVAGMAVPRSPSESGDTGKK